MVTIARWLVVLFGLFLIAVGFIMLLNPQKAKGILRKAGSNNFINYAEITIRMVPATAMVIYSDLSRFPEAFKLMGWFMIATSIVLYFVPRKIHHKYAVYWDDRLKPVHVRFLATFSFIFACLLIYSVF